MLRLIYGTDNDIGIWRTGYSNEFYRLYDEMHIVNVIIIGRPLCLGHLFSM